MRLHRLSPAEIGKAIGLGIVNALALSAIMVPAIRSGVAPIPDLPSLRFAELVLGRSLPLPAGLLFHVAYVTAWSLAYVLLFRERLSLPRALGLGVVLWAVALVVFFPLIGWGVLGLGVSAKLIPAALVPHLLFAVFLWLLCRAGFGRAPAAPREGAG